jgi:hypothetical protein
MLISILPNPVSMFESAINGGLEREAAMGLLSAGLSSSLTFFWKLGKLPLIGTAFQWFAQSMKISLLDSKLFADGKIRLTFPKEMIDPDFESQFETMQKGA